MNFKVQESADKLRGGYYTPAPVALFLAKWLLSKRPRALLEPACGDGAFVRALDGLHNHAMRLTGIEIDEGEAAKAREAARKNRLLRNTEILNRNFLAWALESQEQYDAALGNPPYVRYQYIKKDDQELASVHPETPILKYLCRAFQE
jgi:tRNA1(Val) A37 N6-methylase TrmN6